jgi:hypothetical protein
MNNTPRVLNRILIGILGIMLLAIGVLLVLLASVPAVGVWWHDWAGGVLNFWLDLFERTQFPRRQGSWLWLVICFVLVVVLGLMVAWIAQQGRGRTSLLVAGEDPGDVPGNVGIGGGVAEQTIRAALADRPDLAGVTVAAYEIKGEPALKIRVEPRQGVAPHALAAEVSSLVEALDAVIGRRTPVLIHIGSGTRSRFGRAERVR